jgi:hypothetical protein
MSCDSQTVIAVLFFMDGKKVPKLNLCLCLIKRHAMKMNRGVEV